MATLAQNNLGLIELAKRSGNAGAVAIAEILDQTLELQDAVYLPANGPTSHTITRRLALPAGSWRQLNDGVAKESSKTTQIVETMGLLESYSQVDAKLAAISGNVPGFRAIEDRSFVEGLGQTFATALFYGNPVTTPASFLGLSQRVTSKTATNAFDGGGSGSDNTSIWVVQWGPGRVYLFFPPGTNAGLQAVDKGLQTVSGETSGTLFEAYRTHFEMSVGLAVADNRCIQRICNIESAGASNIFDPDDLVTVINRLPFGGAGAVIYANSTVKTQMDINAMDKTNVNYTSAEVFGRATLLFRGVPVRQVDSLTITETALS